jgi:hypothetical protein
MPARVNISQYLAQTESYNVGKVLCALDKFHQFLQSFVNAWRHDLITIVRFEYLAPNVVEHLE